MQKPDWLFITQSIVVKVDWLILENNEAAILHVYMPYMNDDKTLNKSVTFV